MGVIGTPDRIALHPAAEGGVVDGCAVGMAADLLKRPVGLQERDVAVRVVQVALEDVAVIFRQRRHVKRRMPNVE